MSYLIRILNIRIVYLNYTTLTTVIIFQIYLMILHAKIRLSSSSVAVILVIVAGSLSASVSKAVDSSSNG